jgi:lipopolysaccharide transport system ATP-binding protein
LIAVSAEGVGKKYRRYSADRPWTLQEAVMSGFRNMKAAASFWSLRDVSFAVGRGRALGVIGRNGAGKSTLLRLLGAVGRPDEGRISVEGRVGGLLELTAGFHPDLTGRENVFIGGVIRGLTRREVAHRFGSILDFAELQHAIDRPIRTYSTGMQMRLAFSVAVHAAPDVLLVDEVLAVGDAAFQRKCLDRIADLRRAGCTVVMVSHDAHLVKDMCDDALWLQEGTVADFGPAELVVSKYLQSFRDLTVSRTVSEREPMVTSQGVVLKMGGNRFGSLEIAITDVRLTTGQGSASEMAEDDVLSVELDYEVTSPVDAPIFCITVVHDDGRVCLTTSSDQSQIALPAAPSTGHVTTRLQLSRLDPGTYFIDVGVYEKHWAFAYDYHSRAYPLIIRHRKNETKKPERNVPATAWIHNAREISGGGSVR